MKKLLLVTSLCMLAGFSFAQKKAVKEAKSAIAKTEEARGLIKPALTNEETANDPEAWKVAGDIEFAVFDKQRDAEMLKDMTGGKGADLGLMYSGLYNMVDYYIKADELGQLPDEKGKVKNKVRGDIIKNFRVGYPLFYNAGLYYNDLAVNTRAEGKEEEAKKLYLKSSEIFELYWDMPSYPIFAEEKAPLVLEDSSFQVIKYYSVISAIQSGDDDRSLRMLNKIIASPFIENPAHTEEDLYVLLSERYRETKDSINFVKSLNDGVAKFPKNQYFTTNLVNNYINAGQSEKAIEYLNRAIENDPSSKCELLSVKAGLFANTKNYDESIKGYEDVIAFDPNCERALEGLGIVYFMQIRDYEDESYNASSQKARKEINDKVVVLYEKSLPLIEKYVSLLRARGADAYDMKMGLTKLQNVYYNLSVLSVDKGEELKRIDEELEALSGK